MSVPPLASTSTNFTSWHAITGSARLPLTVAWSTKQVIVITSGAALLVIDDGVDAVGRGRHRGERRGRSQQEGGARGRDQGRGTAGDEEGHTRRVGDDVKPGVWSGFLSVVWATMPA